MLLALFKRLRCMRLLASLALLCLHLTAADDATCIWRVTASAAPLSFAALWQSVESVAEAKTACLQNTGALRGASRCAGFMYRSNHEHSGPAFLALSVDNVGALRSDAKGTVYQHACWPLEGPIIATMTTLRRPSNASYVRRAAATVLAEGLPLLLVDVNPHEPSEVAAWAFRQPGGLRYIRAPDSVGAAVAAALAARAVAREAEMAAAKEQGKVLIFSSRKEGEDRWRWRECLDWAWAVTEATAASDAGFVLYLEDDVLLARSAANDLSNRLAEWATRGGGPADVTAASAAAQAALPKPPPAAVPKRTPSPPPVQPDETAGWMGLSLWSADAAPDGHACANCYTKALVLPRSTALVLAAHVEARFTTAPVDWLLGEVESAGGARLRALVPNLAEHVGDFSSLAGVRREWQRSAYFKQTPFVAAGEEEARAQPEAPIQPRRFGRPRQA